MLKKLFLPLLAITSLGFLVVSTQVVFAANPCSSVENGLRISGSGVTQADVDRCHNGNDYKTWRWNQNNCYGHRSTALSNRCNSISDTSGRNKCSACKELLDGGFDLGTGNNNNTPGPDDSGNGGNHWDPDGNVSNDVDTEDVDGTSRDQHTESDYRGDYHLPEDVTELQSSCRSFLGMVSWDCNTNFENASEENDIPRIVVMIASNVFNDITVIAAFLVIGYIIYGGYLYIFANGDTGKVTTGKKALNQAFIGLAITLSANIIINAIRIALMHNNGAFTECATSECVTADDLVVNLIQWVVGICGAVAAAFIVGGGIMYMTSAGDPTKLTTAKNIIKYALIGLIIVALAEVIAGFMGGVINNAKGGNSNDSNSTGYIINTKELYEKNKIS